MEVFIRGFEVFVGDFKFGFNFRFFNLVRFVVLNLFEVFNLIEGFFNQFGCFICLFVGLYLVKKGIKVCHFTFMESHLLISLISFNFKQLDL